MNLVFVGHRCCDHSPSSGYDQVCALFPGAGWLSGPALAAGHLSWFREPADGSAAIRASSPQLFHVFYGDCSGSALPGILRARFPWATIVSTVHQPVSRLRHDAAGMASLGASDAIITVSREQARQLAAFALTTPVHVLPHGVWNRVFRPPTASAAGVRDSVLLVGSYLRDWDGTRQVVARLAAAGVRSVLLDSAAPDGLPSGNPLVEISPRVCEPALAAMYARSAALILPVLDATASNALLEAMAAGCPVICPRFPSLVGEYLGDATDSYAQGRYDQAVARALTYIRQPELRATRSHTLMNRAALFDWARLRPLFAAVYQKIADRHLHRCCDGCLGGPLASSAATRSIEARSEAGNSR